jgi:glycosyl hydrolase family 28
MRNKMLKFFSCVAVLATLAGVQLFAAGPPLKKFDVMEFGAAGNGQAKETRAIQQAVDAAHAAGGGTVYFPPGRYLSGTVILKSYVTLYLETGAALLGSTDSLDFPHFRPKFRSFTDGYVSQSLIYAEDQEEIGIAGGGTIDGQGQAFQWKKYGNRPDVIRMVTCRHVTIQDVHLRNSPMWMQHYLGCEFVTIRGLNVINHSTYNNDMIDIDCCRNVTISDCYGNTDDDALTFKSTADHPTENVTVTNCVLGSGCNAIKMGTESNGGFKNISITNCVIDSWIGKKGFYALPKGIGGVVLEIVDGGTMENVTISNISIKNVMVPLFLRLANRARKFKPEMETPGKGTYRNVTISNIIATGVDLYGCSITGMPDNPIKGVSLSNLRFEFPGGGTEKHFSRPVPEKEKDYPEAIMFDELPSWGFYVRHAEGIRFNGLDLVLKGGDVRPALIFEDVRDLSIDGFRETRIGKGLAPTVILRDVSDAMLRGCRPDAGSPAFLGLEGRISDVSVMNNDLSRVPEPLRIPEEMDRSAVFLSGNRTGK